MTAILKMLSFAQTIINHMKRHFSSQSIRSQAYGQEIVAPLGMKSLGCLFKILANVSNVYEKNGLPSCF